MSSTESDTEGCIFSDNSSHIGSSSSEKLRAGDESDYSFSSDNDNETELLYENSNYTIMEFLK
jgi:hypothetical protein